MRTRFYFIFFLLLSFYFSSFAQSVNLTFESDCTIDYSDLTFTRISSTLFDPGSSFFEFPFNWNGSDYDSAKVSLYQPAIFLKKTGLNEGLTIFPIVLPLELKSNSGSFVDVFESNFKIVMSYHDVRISRDVMEPLYGQVGNESLNFTIMISATGKIDFSLDNLVWNDNPMYVKDLGLVIRDPEVIFGPRAGDTLYIPFGLILNDNFDRDKSIAIEERNTDDYDLVIPLQDYGSFRSDSLSNLCFRLDTDSTNYVVEAQSTLNCPTTLDQYFDTYNSISMPYTVYVYAISSGQLIYTTNSNQNLDWVNALPRGVNAIQLKSQHHACTYKVAIRE